ncbi:alpha-1,2-mannosidase, putative [Mucilaginibacter sp. OK268]|uniref:GH92 family glycosyl hydrolase n=1 Tax=Mucilaginibacter sp. OK268 TaxID=1881048 RepID=UPI0008854CB8|nr:GH92 family glycosyl hydrolase [Mucilaginibacter sp. OK268]SDP90781.1 alpha-1,2-mannosidase, putative [Mucilaginibacter sp. OK268]
MYKTSFIVKKTVWLLLLLLVITLNINAQSRSNLSYVNPFIGTTKSGVLTHWGGDGGTYPGAVAPAGFIQISPETRVKGANGYDYADSSIYYFSCFGHHSGFPGGSAGRLFIMPVGADKYFEPGRYSNCFSHRNEVARPGYYQVKFSDNHIITEVSTSIRTGILRFTFPAKTKAQVYIGNAGDITIVSGKVIHGAALNTVINFSEAFTDKKPVKGGYLFTFKTTNTSKVIEVKLSTSTISFAGAQNNIDKEIAKLSFGAYATRTANDWAKQLSTVDITDKSEANKTVFYTALYHSLLIPWVISDVDGNYRGEDGAVHHASGKLQYGGFSPWDTFRSLHPLLSLLYPDKQNDVVLSMLDIYKQTGHLPTESMTGNHAIPIIVDAYLKGITGFDKTLAYKAMKSNIVDSPFVQKDMSIYHRMGYVPYTNSESVTRTVEYAYNDWALSQYAKQVMHNEVDYQLLQQRGFNYRNLFHPEDLFLLPRSGNDFKINPAMSGYKEGDKWVYSYFVPHNAKDLVNLMGSDNAFSVRLDSALNNSIILFDNETVIHLPYLFNAAGRPDLTQKWCRDIMLSRYKNLPDGLPGNDDLGAMSSAYIFNAMGIFPVSPGKPEYAIGAPLFQSITLHLQNHKTWVIEAKNQSAGNKYVSALTVNGKAYEQLVLPHATITGGGEMQFTLNNNAYNSWPTDKDPIVLSETKTSSDIKVTNYSLQKTKVEPNEQLWLRFTVQNNGSIGTTHIRVYAAGKVVANKNYLVSQGSTIADSISCRLYRLGKVTVGLDSAGGSTVEVVESAQPVKSPFEIFGVTIKPLIHRGQEQQINYMVKNLTGKDQSFAIPVKLNDSLLYTDHVQLAPGESKPQAHSFVDQINGVKNLIINDLRYIYKVFSDDKGSLLLDLSLTEKGNDQIIGDKSGFGNDANIIHPKTIELESGKMILLGDNCFVEVPNAPSLDNLGQTITMMAWVYPEGKETGLVDMFTKGDTHVLQMIDNKALTFFAGGWGRGDCTVNLPTNWKQNWHHIAGVCSGNVLSVYIDGKLAGTSTVEGPVNLSVANKWQIGRNEEFPSERIFHGYMDGIKVFAQPLSATGILDIFNKEQAHYKSQPGN